MMTKKDYMKLVGQLYTKIENKKKTFRRKEKSASAMHEINKLAGLYIDLTHEVEQQLNKLSYVEQYVLRRHFLNKKTLYEVANELNYSTRSINRFKKKGLENLEILESDTLKQVLKILET